MTLDLLLVVLGVIALVSGYRRGLLIGVGSLIGLVAGAAVGLALAGPASEQVANPRLSALAAIIVTLALALAGQVAGAALAASIRNRLHRAPARTADALLGAAFSVLALAVVVLLVATAVAAAPFPLLSRQVRESQVVALLDRAAPPLLREAGSAFSDMVTAGTFPDFLGPLVPTPVQPVDPPDTAAAATPQVAQAAESVVRVFGEAPACDKSFTGSGFTYAPERVMTNAHVVAGMTAPRVQVGGRRYQARVVVFDPGRDLAVLRVPGLDLAALPFAGPAADGADAVVAGFPGGGPRTLTAARIRGVISARGRDIYGQATVVREVYTIRAQVQPGASGGPLLAPDGSVYGVVFAAATDVPDTGFVVTAAEADIVADLGRGSAAAVDTGQCAL